MTTHLHNNFAEHAGRWIGRSYQKLLRREKRLAAWLIKRGVPGGLSKIVLWAIGLVVLAAVLYLSVILAVILLGLMFVTLLASNADAGGNEDRQEWRDGPLGYGLYDQDGFRVDPHEADDNQ